MLIPVSNNGHSNYERNVLENLNGVCVLHFLTELEIIHKLVLWCFMCILSRKADAAAEPKTVKMLIKGECKVQHGVTEGTAKINWGFKLLLVLANNILSQKEQVTFATIDKKKYETTQEGNTMFRSH